MVSCVVVWMKMSLIGLCLWMFGPELMELLGKIIIKMWPCWNWFDLIGRGMCWGWALRFQKCIPVQVLVFLPAACGSGCSALSYRSGSMPVRFSPWWSWTISIKPLTSTQLNASFYMLPLECCLTDIEQELKHQLHHRIRIKKKSCLFILVILLLEVTRTHLLYDRHFVWAWNSRCRHRNLHLLQFSGIHLLLCILFA